MKEEFKKWLEFAKEDHETAKFNFEGKKYRFAAYLCQQAIEKAFKAVLLKKTGHIRKIHDLVELGKNIELSSNLLDEVKELTLAYIYSRYPDVEQAHNLKDKVNHFLEISEKMLKWVEENL